MRRQRVLLTGGLLLGLLGAALTFTYVRGVEGRATSGSEMVTAYVATATIPAGTPGSQIGELTTTKRFPRAYLQPNALGELGAVDSQFTLRQITQGQTLTQTDFGEVGASAGRLPIPRGHEAVAIATTLDGGLGEYAQPGDRVTVYATFRQPVPSTRKLLSNVLVIATRANPEAGDRLTGTPPGSTGQLLFVLAVTPKQAGKVIFGQRLGEVSLTLIPEGQTSPDPDDPASPDDATAGLSRSLLPAERI
ncbi:MAG: Flp pilus assembly protein CpaB [Actinomycetota bacterium]